MAIVIKIYNAFADLHDLNPIKESQIAILRSKYPLDILEELHLPLIQIPSLIHDIKKGIQERADEICLFPGIEAQLRKLADTHQLILVSSNDLQAVSTVLNRYNLNIFHPVISEPHWFSKHRVFLSLINKLDAMPEEIIYIGDEIRDIKAAKKAGIQSCAVGWGFQSLGILEAYHPDICIPEVARLYSGLNNGRLS